jgi:hypothetical protein
MHKIEQTFTSINATDHITAQYHVPFKSNCYVFQDLQETVDGEENGNHVVFGKSGIYGGDVLTIFGFVYKGNVKNSDKDTFEWIDAEHYRSQLQNLVEGTDVYVYQHTALGKKSGRVKALNDSRCEIQMQNSNTIIEIDTMQIWKNNEFVFAKSNKRRFAMSGIVQEGVAFSLLRDDKHGNLTIKTFVPSPSIIAVHNTDRIADIPSLKFALESYGYKPWHYQHISQKILSDVLAISHEPKTNNPREPLQFTNFTAIDSFGKMPDYEKYEFDHYRFEKGFADNEFHRMMHLFHQGDAGLIHMLELLTLNIKSTKTRVDKYIDILGTPLVEEDTAPTADDPCTSRARIYKKEYHSIESLKSDNNKVLEGVGNGDYAKLVEGDRVQDFRRDAGVWIQSTSNMLLKCNNLDDFPVKYSELVKLDCLYDDLKMLCTSMQAMKDNVKKNNHIDTVKMFQNTQDFRQQIDDYFLNMEELKKEVGGMLRLYKVLASNAIATDVTDRITYQEPNHDYCNHIGNANAFDFEGTFGNINFNEQYAYSVQKLDTIDVILPGKPNDTDIYNTHREFIDAIVDAVGIVFSKSMLDYLVQQLASMPGDLFNTEAAIDQKVSDKRDQLVAMFKKTIRQKLKAELKKDPTVADIDKQKNIFNKKLGPLLLEYKKKLSSQMKDGDKLALFNACGMIAVFAQINLGYFRHINPKCRDKLHDGMAAYVSCVIHKMSTGGDKFFKPATGMTPSQIDTLLSETISRILTDNENLSLAFEQKRTLIEAKTEKKSGMIDWPSFRPLIQEIHGSNITGYKAPNVKDSKRKSILKPLMIIKPSVDLAGDRVMFISKHISLPTMHETNPFVKSVTLDEFGDLKNSNLPKKLIDAMKSTELDSEAWESLIDSSLIDYRGCMEKLQIKSQEVHALFATPKSHISQVANSLRSFVCGELKAILGKLKSRWKIENPDTASEGDVKLAKLMEKMTNSAGVYNLIMPKLELSIRELANVSILNKIASSEFRMYAYLYMLVVVICNLSMKKQPLISELVQFILANYIESNEMNTYSPERIKHEQEALREKSKESIIARFEGMDEESRRAIQEIKKAGHKTLIDLFMDANAEDGEAGKGGEGGEGGAGGDPGEPEIEPNEDVHEYQGDNDDGVINEDDFVEDNDDANIIDD